MRILTAALMIVVTEIASGQGAYGTGVEDRAYTVEVMVRLARPVMGALAEDRLTAALPIHEWETKHRDTTVLEAYARTLAGLAPWLELGPQPSAEGVIRAEMQDLSLRATHHILDPKSSDHQQFGKPQQVLVEAAFLAQAMLRAPGQLWGKLSVEDQGRMIEAWKLTRVIPPHRNNWLLFSAMVEAALWKFTGSCDIKPIENAVTTHETWFLGDGTYGDGPQFHWDYYNSYVIQPMLLDVLRVCRENKHPLGDLYAKEVQRAQRYASVLERMISPEGTYPVMGRSSAYRFANMQLLTQVFLQEIAPKSLDPGSTRSALTAVIRRIIGAAETFDDKGWLQIGVVGYQPKIRDSYNATGSLYLTTTGLLHLGLPPDHRFWTAPSGAWTQKRIWSGDPDAPKDEH